MLRSPAGSRVSTRQSRLPRHQTRSWVRPPSNVVVSSNSSPTGSASAPVDSAYPSRPRPWPRPPGGAVPQHRRGPRRRAARAAPAGPPRCSAPNPPPPASATSGSPRPRYVAKPGAARSGQPRFDYGGAVSEERTLTAFGGGATLRTRFLPVRHRSAGCRVLRPAARGRVCGHDRRATHTLALRRLRCRRHGLPPDTGGLRTMSAQPAASYRVCLVAGVSNGCGSTSRSRARADVPARQRTRGDGTKAETRLLSQAAIHAGTHRRRHENGP